MPLAAPTPTLTSRTDGQTVVAITPTGGTAPYAYQWHRKLLSVDWTPDEINDIPGATASTLTDNAVAGNELWAYRCVVTDDAAASATSPYLIVEGLAASPVTPPLRALTSDGLIYVAVGDSLTAADTGETTASVLVETYNIPAVHHSNQGAPGATLTGFATVIDPPSSSVADAIDATEALEATYPTAVVVWSLMFGTNDCAFATPEQMVAAMEDVIDLCEGRGWLVEIKLPPYAAPSGFVDNAGLDRLMSYRAALAALANDTTVFLGDERAFYYVFAHQELLTDGTHFSPAGYEAIGTLWADAARLNILGNFEADNLILNQTSNTDPVTELVKRAAVVVGVAGTLTEEVIHHSGDYPSQPDNDYAYAKHGTPQKHVYAWTTTLTLSEAIALRDAL